MREVEKLKDKNFDRNASVASFCLQGVTLVYTSCCSKIHKVHSTVRGNGRVGSLANNEIQVFVQWSEAAI